MNENSRDTQEKNLDESYENLDFWQQIRLLSTNQFKEIQIDINQKLNKINEDVNDKLKSIDKNIQDKLEDISEKLSFVLELKKTFNDELVNLNNLNNILKEFKTTNVVINNPTYDDLIILLKDMLFQEAKEDNSRFNKYIDTKNNLLNKLIADKIGDLEKLAKKTVDSTDIILNNFNQFSDTMKKGNDSILSSEVIVGKLLYALRFIEKLPANVQEELLTFSKTDFENIAKYVNENRSKEVGLQAEQENENTSSIYLSQVTGSTLK